MKQIPLRARNEETRELYLKVSFKDEETAHQYALTVYEELGMEDYLQ